MKKKKSSDDGLQAIKMISLVDDEVLLKVDQKFSFTNIFVFLGFAFIFVILIAISYIEPDAFYRTEMIFRNVDKDKNVYEFNKIYPVYGNWKVEGLQASNESIELYVKLPLITNKNNQVAFICISRFYYLNKPLYLKRTRVNRSIQTPSTKITSEINYTFHIWTLSNFNYTSFEIEFKTVNETNINNAYLLYRSKNVNVSSWYQYFAFWVTVFHFCIVAYNHYKGNNLSYEQKLVYLLEISIILYNNPLSLFNYYYPSKLISNCGQYAHNIFISILFLYLFYSFSSCFEISIYKNISYLVWGYFIYTLYWNSNKKNNLISKNIFTILETSSANTYVYVQIGAFITLALYIFILSAFAPFTSVHRFTRYLFINIIYISWYFGFLYYQNKYLNPDSSLNLFYFFALLNTYGFHISYLHSTYERSFLDNYEQIQDAQSDNNLDLLVDEQEVNEGNA